MKFREENGMVWYWCEGCKTHHSVDPNRWSVLTPDGKLTIHPSVLVRGHDSVCHHFVGDGRIMYLTDSTHDLRGHTVELSDLP